MKRLIPLLILPFVLFSVNSGAQEAVERLKSQLAGSRITLKYSYRTQGDVPLSGEGTLLMQGKCYKVKGNGLEIFCDGKSQWTVDREAAEVYIENAAGTETELFFTNPELLLSNISNVSSGPASLSGTYTDPGGKATINFNLTEIKATEIVSGNNEFSFDTSALGDEWTVTDLR